jgi:hypothetical protein
MVILRGKRKNLTTPLTILGQNVGEKIYIYTKAKRMVILWGKLKNYKPPLSYPQNMPHDFFAYGLF